MSTLNSETFSSNELEDLEIILYRLLEGRINTTQAIDALRTHISVDFRGAPNFRVINQNDLDGIFKIPVSPEHLQKMLELCLHKKITELELSNWAALIFMTGVFIPIGETEENRWETGKGPVWNIIQELITPDIFGGLGPKRLENYLRTLRKF